MLEVVQHRLRVVDDGPAQAAPAPAEPAIRPVVIPVPAPSPAAPSVAAITVPAPAADGSVVDGLLANGRVAAPSPARHGARASPGGFSPGPGRPGRRSTGTGGSAVRAAADPVEQAVWILSRG